jgi:hypothetical protein
VLAALLCLVLQDSDETLRERVIRLAKDPEANRAELLKLGPTALRPLLDVRTFDLEPIIRDLKFAGDGGAAIRKKLESRLTMRVKGMKVDPLVRFLSSTAEIPIFIDPGVRASVEKKMTDLDLNNAPLEEWVRNAAAQAGLEYGFVRGVIVLSTPDRLWSYPAEKPKLLDEADIAALKKQVDALVGDDAAIRAAAARSLTDTGEPAIPHLETAMRGLADDRRARIRDLINGIRARVAPPILGLPLSIERQELGEAGKAILAALGTKKASLDVENLQLSAAVKLLLAQVDVMGEGAPAADKVRIACDIRELPAIDGLYFVAVTHGFDVCLKDGRVWLDTREAIEKVLKGR